LEDKSVKWSDAPTREMARVCVVWAIDKLAFKSPKAGPPLLA
jgi:hypothetical protein